MMAQTYIHFLDRVPRYVGEGKPGREMDFSRRRNYTPHGRWLNKHRDEHICVLVTSRHSDKVGAKLQEQGLIMWLGRKIENKGPLLNFLPYGTLQDLTRVPDEVRKKLGDVSRGIPKTAQHKEKLRLAANKRSRIQCPHCGTTGDPGPMTRWHFENCKHKL